MEGFEPDSVDPPRTSETDEAPADAALVPQLKSKLAERLKIINAYRTSDLGDPAATALCLRHMAADLMEIEAILAVEAYDKFSDGTLGVEQLGSVAIAMIQLAKTAVQLVHVEQTVNSIEVPTLPKAPR